MNIAESIKYIRKKSMLSQEEFARELNVSFATVNRWETGKTKPNYKTLRLIAEYCSLHKIEFPLEDNGVEKNV